jgi:hypothetical protein
MQKINDFQHLTKRNFSSELAAFKEIDTGVLLCPEGHISLAIIFFIP